MSDLRLAVSEAGRRIQEIIDTAERVAVEIRAEAEQEAASYLRERGREADRQVEERERELTELTKTIADRAARVQKELSALLESLQDAVGRVTELGATATTSGSLSMVGAQPAAERGRDEPIPGEALLRLTQMALAGSDRAELERTLRDEFGIEDTSSILDEMLGPSIPDRGPRLGRFVGPA